MSGCRLPMSLPGVGALAKWRHELRAGTRGHPGRWATWPLDDLWAAACHEKTAIELEAQGDLHGARDFMDWARCRLHGIKDEWEAKALIRAHNTKAGRALLAKFRSARDGSKDISIPRTPFGAVVPRDGDVWRVA